MLQDMKTCKKCGEAKPCTEQYFSPRKSSRDGFRNQCKVCKAQYSRQYYEENKDEISEKQQEYYQKNKDAKLSYQRKYYQDNKEGYSEYNRQYREDNKEKYSEYKRQYYEENKDEISEKQRQYREDNREHYSRYFHQYRKDNKKKIAERDARYYQENKERLMRYSRQYYEENKTSEEFKNKRRIRRARRRTREKDLPHTFTHEQWSFCLAYFNFTCPVCDNQLRDLFGDIEPHADHWTPLSNDDCPGTIATNMICLCNKCNLSKHAKDPEEWLLENYSRKQANTILEEIETYFACAADFWDEPIEWEDTDAS